MKRLTKRIAEKIATFCWDNYIAQYGIPRELYDGGTIELDRDGITCEVRWKLLDWPHEESDPPEIVCYNVYFDEKTGDVLQAGIALD